MPGRDMLKGTIPKGIRLREAKQHSLIPQRHLRQGPGSFWDSLGLVVKVINGI